MSPDGATTIAGDLSLEDAFALLEKDGRAVLVDVRTEPEWQFVGVPDLARAWDGRQSSSNGRSIPRWRWRAISSRALPRNCAGAAPTRRRRSCSCADPARARVTPRLAMTNAGWSHCYNIAEGFEGVLDANRHRGKLNGWQARGLPWKQT